MAAPGPLGSLLLATEHSEQDQGAERAAFALARRLAGVGASGPSAPLESSRLSTPVTLAVVMPLLSNPEYETVAPQLAERAEADAGRRRQALEADAVAAGVSLDLQVRRGSEPFREIVAAAEERAATLLIVRRRGHRGLLANLLIGEMVSKVLAHAPCPALVVPREAAAWQRAVLVGVDPQRPDDALVAYASAVAAASGLPLHLVCVVSRESERARAEEALRGARATWPTAPASSEVRIGSAHAEIIEAARAHEADLIVVGRHGGGALGRAWIGGVTQKVIGLASCAVLVHVPAR